MTDKDIVELSDSAQMYLVTIARLRENGRPVSLSHLADTLSISPVSVNEMCRKLQDQGLVLYQPYKGASLTEEGDERACFILRRHRLWEVFLVDHLGFEYGEAHDIACQLEHATPDILADQLDLFLDFPPVNPLGEPIIRCGVQLPAKVTVPLSTLSSGHRGRVVRCDVGGAPQSFLEEQGIRPGAWLDVVATSGDSMLVQLGQGHVSLAQSLAEAIQLEASLPRGHSVDGPLERRAAKNRSFPINLEDLIAARETKEDTETPINEEKAVQQVPLSTLKVGQRGIVVRVGGKGAVKRRMMDMGLVPGSEVCVRRVAPLGDPIEFTIKGYSLSLRKSEAKEIQVELVE